MSEVPKTKQPLTLRLVVSNQLRLVGELLDKALQEPEGPKVYHRLRVSIRRVRSDLRILKGAARDLPIKRLKDRLKSLFEAAGEVRRFDIALTSLADRHGATDDMTRAALELSMVWLREDRKQAVESFMRIAGKSQRKLSHRTENLFVSIDQEQAFLETNEDLHLCETMMDLLQERRCNVRDAAHEVQPTPRRLHQLRVQCKKLRYLLERIDATCQSSQFDSYLERLVQLQDELGSINDSHDLAVMLNNHHGRIHEVVELLEPSTSAVLSRKMEELAVAYHQQVEGTIAAFVHQWEQNGRNSLLQMLDGLPNTRALSSEECEGSSCGQPIACKAAAETSQ